MLCPVNVVEEEEEEEEVASEVRLNSSKHAKRGLLPQHRCSGRSCLPTIFETSSTLTGRSKVLRTMTIPSIPMYLDPGQEHDTNRVVNTTFSRCPCRVAVFQARRYPRSHERIIRQAMRRKTEQRPDQIVMSRIDGGR